MMDGIPRDQGRITIERETSGDDHRKRSLISCSSPPSSDTAIDRANNNPKIRNKQRIDLQKLWSSITHS